MNIPIEDARLFFKLFFALLAYTNRQLKVVPNVNTPVAAQKAGSKKIVKVRDALEDYLWRLAQGDLRVRLELVVRLQDLAGVPPPAPSPSRTVAQIRRAAEQLQQAEERQRAAEAEAQRVRELEALAQREESAWQEVEQHIQHYTSKSYEEAVALLQRLQQVAQYKRQQKRFQERIDSIYERYPTRRSLIDRLQQAGLERSTRGKSSR